MCSNAGTQPNVALQDLAQVCCTMLHAFYCKLYRDLHGSSMYNVQIVNAAIQAAVKWLSTNPVCCMHARLHATQHTSRTHLQWHSGALQVVDQAGWLHTGDMAVLDDKGYCRIVGRLKDMIVRGGENISPREVEEVVHQHPAVMDVQVRVCMLCIV